MRSVRDASGVDPRVLHSPHSKMNVSFRPGELLGRYTVVAPIGAGGMGEVYKAVDPTLDRTVALKILPPELVRNDERVRRFVQEAKSASSLTHPHIVTIYEIGTASLVKDIENADGKPIHYIAMELVDGPTLKHLIHQERTDLRTLVRYLAQAADGLAKAHAAGIVHRDLKPENIVVSKDRFAKVLDFGLAKLTERTEAADISGSRTAVREQTRDGIVVGTVGYMSPEQVQARPVDHRSDIFSFGCILYEAASRHKPFVADSDVDVMHKIVHDKPEPLDDIVPPIPGELRRIIRRCLAKEPEKRFQSMKDLAIDLAEIDEQWNELSTSSVSGSGSGSSAAVALPPRMSRRAVIASAAVVIAILAAALFGVYRWARGRAVPQKADTFSSMKIAPVTASGDLRTATVSPDGKYVAHVRTSSDGFSIVMRQLATGSDAVIVPAVTHEVFALAFSPDGNYLYYLQREAETVGYSSLYQVPTLGGRPRKILFDIDTRPSFSPDARQFTFIRGNPPVGESYIMIANVDGSAARKVLTLKSPERFETRDASWSPDGKAIAVAVQDDRQGLSDSIEAVDVATAARHPIGGRRFHFPIGLTWASDGNGVILTASDVSPAQPPQLWLLPWPGGAARRITNDLSSYGQPTVTSDGKGLVTTRSQGVFGLWGQGRNASDERRLASGSAPIGLITASSQALYYMTPTVKGVAIWTARLDGQDMRPLISDEAVNYDPAVPVDGRFLLYVAIHGKTASAWQVDPDGANPRQVASNVSLAGVHIMDVAPDGEWFVYSTGDGRNLIKAPLGGGQPVEIVHDRFGGSTHVAPDGKSIFGTVWETGTVGRGGRIFHLDGTAPAVVELRGHDYDWAPDGNALTYLREIRGVSNVWRQPLDGGASVQITHFTSGRINSYTWTPDGTLIIARAEVTTDAVMISDFR